ncbi:unnamed protein product, partial [Musa textilis]
MTLKENGKQHKSEDFYAGKKIKDRKEKMIGCSSMVNMHYNQPDSEAACSVMMYDGNHINQFSSEAFPVIDSRTKNLLEDNAKLLHQIAVNSENNEIQNNIDLLYRTNNNITAILNSMLETPGIMSQMPPLPVYANENLLHSILRATSQAVEELVGEDGESLLALFSGTGDHPVEITVQECGLEAKLAARQLPPVLLLGIDQIVLHRQ